MHQRGRISFVDRRDAPSPVEARRFPPEACVDVLIQAVARSVDPGGGVLDALDIALARCPLPSPQHAAARLVWWGVHAGQEGRFVPANPAASSPAPLCQLYMVVWSPDLPIVVLIRDGLFWYTEDELARAEVVSP